MQGIDFREQKAQETTLALVFPEGLREKVLFRPQARGNVQLMNDKGEAYHSHNPFKLIALDCLEEYLTTENPDKLIEAVIPGTESDNNGSDTYIDLIIPEIPDKACLLNSDGKKIICRIPIKNTNASYLNIYEPTNISSNYFFPISLNQITIQLINQNNTAYYTSSNNSIYNSFIFEITILNNLSLIQ